MAYPEIRQFVAAVVSAAGSVGGSPLANDVRQSQLNLVRNWPGAECSPGDGGAIESQLLFYDQVIPDSALIGYLNADHWALTVPIARSHKFLGSTFVNHNDFPREALLEAILRFIEEDLAGSAK